MAHALRRFLSSSLSIWLALTIYGVYFLSDLKRHINFGIDLVGGTYITLQVQMAKLFERELIERVQMLDSKITGSRQKFQNDSLVVEYSDEKIAERMASSATQRRSPQQPSGGLVASRQGAIVTYALSSQERTALTKEAVESNISVLRSRVDRFGVGEIPINAQGDDRIAVELPNVQDVARAKAMIGTSALLEVKPVIDQGVTEQDILERYGNSLPEGTEIVPGATRAGDSEGRMFYLVPRYAELTGRLLKTARMNPSGGEFGFEPVVEFEFTTAGGDKFYELTKRPDQSIAMIVDGVVVTAARAREPLRSRGYISGDFTVEGAQELAAMLRSGAFVAPVTFEEDRTIEATLGQASIRQGLLSCFVGMVLLLIFSLVVYKTAGALAFVVLLYNLLLILIALSFLGATLTLPGIAGIVLTIGMAIDASILIYERVREELHKGAPLRTAIDAGFSGATMIILDANITHFLVAVVLYKLGAGVIQGFAVSMIVGIIATLLTGLVLLKSIFSFILDCGVKQIKI